MTISKQRALPSLFFVAMLLALSGCVRESNVDGDRVFQFELWVSLTAFLAGLVVAPIGWVMREWSARVAWSLIILGPVATLFVAPSLFRERVAVNDNRFEVQSGIWGLTATHSVPFSEIKEIRITAETSTSRRGRRTSYYLICDKQNGKSNKVSINNDVTEASAGAILETAVGHGIPIRDETAGK